MRWLLVFALITGFISSPGDVSAHPIDYPAFERTWARTDKPVAEGRDSRTWMWGPEGHTEAFMERYDDAPGGNRLVQYMDKSRMEDNSFQADPPWDVTNGLLAWELITGAVQVGDSKFIPAQPSDIQIAGDNHPESPSYATFSQVMDEGSLPPDSIITQTINRSGTIGYDDNLRAHDVRAQHHVGGDIDHTVASVFWDFMNSTGEVFEDGQFVDANLFEDPFYATGYPITGAYWMNVPVGGEWRDVLAQCFERRCLTYTPGNPRGWEVEAGNIGQHYREWRQIAELPGTLIFGAATLRFQKANGSAESTITVIDNPDNTPGQLPIESDGYGNARVSPTGDQVAMEYVYAPEPVGDVWIFNRTDVVVVDIDGTSYRKLTESESARHPSWSPDGKWIAYSDREQDGDPRRIFVRRDDGTSAEVIDLSIDFSWTHPEWSPDGDSLALLGWHLDEDSPGIWIAGRSSSDARKVADCAVTCSHPSWSPDGEILALTEWTDNGPNVVAFDLDTNERHILVKPDEAGKHGGSEPTWSPDGEFIVYKRTDRTSPNSRVIDGLWVMNRDGSNKRFLRYENGAPSDWIP